MMQHTRIEVSQLQLTLHLLLIIVHIDLLIACTIDVEISIDQLKHALWRLVVVLLVRFALVLLFQGASLDVLRSDHENMIVYGRDFDQAASFTHSV